MHYGRRLIHFQENILWHWIQMIYLFTLQRQFFLCCVYTHIDLDWPGFSCFVYMYHHNRKTAFSFVISCRLSRRIILQNALSKLKSIAAFQNNWWKLISIVAKNLNITEAWHCVMMTFRVIWLVIFTNKHNVDNAILSSPLSAKVSIK